MKYHYQFGATRWFRWDRDADIRCHRPPKGWGAEAVMRNTHPITGKAFKQAQWWIKETFTND